MSVHRWMALAEVARNRRRVREAMRSLSMIRLRGATGGLSRVRDASNAGALVRFVDGQGGATTAGGGWGRRYNLNRPGVIAALTRQALRECAGRLRGRQV